MPELWEKDGVGTRLGEAIIHLLRESTIDKISVKEICAEAHVNRSTFYNYFDDKYQLCEAVMNAAVEVFVETFEERIAFLKKDDIELRPEKYLTSNEILGYYLELIRKYRDVFEIFAMNQGMIYSKEQYDELVTTIVLPVLKQYQIDDVRQADYMASFYLGAIHSVVLAWIRNDCEEPTSYIADVIRRCLHIPNQFIDD